ncbi:uncharacterized protein VP01_51g11 [Puccinia sorghi]|uniref:DUF659 domain-containing protein n=1 Tax=Puccinia sorghi TaxID=27349 RepID=A0A0L6UKP2_9BASI|nr:uncharacterized protein VP01_51g11 [Puccinia sorghi]
MIKHLSRLHNIVDLNKIGKHQTCVTSHLKQKPIECHDILTPKTSPKVKAMSHVMFPEREIINILVSLPAIYGKHKGENFDLALFDTLKQLKLTNYMVSITTDNASNNTTLAEKAEELISGTFQASNHLLEGMAHVIDLEAREGLGYFF